jgi:hypothetical protein
VESVAEHTTAFSIEVNNAGRFASIPSTQRIGVAFSYVQGKFTLVTK